MSVSDFDAIVVLADVEVEDLLIVQYGGLPGGAETAWARRVFGLDYRGDDVIRMMWRSIG